jgi:hypothetical protein
MPLGAALPENQPAPSVDAIDALRSKLQRFKDRLLSAKRHGASPLPDLAWHKDDLKDLSVLVHAVYMASHKHAGTTGGKELLWVNGHYRSLRLLKTIGDMVKAVPLRPVAAIERELLKIDASFSSDHLTLRLEKQAIARHKALEQSNPRYRSLVRLSSALGEPKNSITCVRVDDFKDVLRELCPEILQQLELGFERLKGERVERLISRTLFLELQRQELVWRLAYWDHVGEMARWIHGLHDDDIMKLLSDVGVYRHETPEEYLVRRNRRATKERVARHRRKRPSISS